MERTDQSFPRTLVFVCPPVLSFEKLSSDILPGKKSVFLRVTGYPVVPLAMVRCSAYLFLRAVVLRVAFRSVQFSVGWPGGVFRRVACKSDSPPLSGTCYHDLKKCNMRGETYDKRWQAARMEPVE